LRDLNVLAQGAEVQVSMVKRQTMCSNAPLVTPLQFSPSDRAETGSASSGPEMGFGQISG